MYKPYLGQAGQLGSRSCIFVLDVFLPAMATPGRLRRPSDDDDNASTVGTAPQDRLALAKVEWGFPIVHFLDLKISFFEELARQLDENVALDILLLMVSARCSRRERSWWEAQRAGIPWEQKRWTAALECKGGLGGALSI